MSAIQRRDHDHRPSALSAGKLKGERFGCAGRHDADGIATFEDAFDQRSLSRAESTDAEMASSLLDELGPVPIASGFVVVRVLSRVSCRDGVALRGVGPTREPLRQRFV
jgi:hypothetical protein